MRKETIIAVFERDRGVCFRCNTDLVAKKIEHDAMTNPCMQEKLAGSYAVGKRTRHNRWWTIDHILPLADEGTDNLDNLRTACLPCHKKVTKEQRPGSKRPRHVTQGRLVSAMWNGGDGLPHDYIDYVRDRGID